MCHVYTLKDKQKVSMAKMAIHIYIFTISFKKSKLYLNMFLNSRKVTKGRGAELLILTPAWCHNELVVIADGGKC